MSVNSSDANRQEDYDPWETPFDPDDPDYNPNTGKLFELLANPTEDYDVGDLDERQQPASKLTLPDLIIQGETKKDYEDGRSGLTIRTYPTGIISMMGLLTRMYKASSISSLQRLVFKHGLSYMNQDTVIRDIRKNYKQVQERSARFDVSPDILRMLEGKSDLHLVRPFSDQRTTFSMYTWTYSELQARSVEFGMHMSGTAITAILYSLATVDDERFAGYTTYVVEELNNIKRILKARRAAIEALL